MTRLLRQELHKIISFKFVFLWSILIISPILYTLLRIKEYSLLDRLDFYELTMSTMLPLLFPLIVVLIYLVSFSNEITNNFIFYTRLRIDIENYLVTKFTINAILVFIIMFSFSFIPFVFAFYIEPLFNFIVYEPENSGLTFSELIRNSYERLTFSQLLEYGSFIYGFSYSVWVGLNGILYSSLGFLSLLLLKNRFLALSIPFLLYHLGSFIIAVLGFPMLLLDASIFPYNTIQFPIWVVFIPFLFILLICIGVYVYIRKSLYTLDNLG